MSWNDLGDLEHSLAESLRSFNYDSAARILAHINSRLQTEPDPFPDTSARNILRALRRTRQFSSMTLFAESLIQAGNRALQVRRQYAQALIDQGMLTAAELVLQSLLQDSQSNKVEEAEARGLTGRIQKQLYVNSAATAQSERRRGYLQRAFNEYSFVYTSDPVQHTWHGINVVALLARAEREGVSLQGVPEYRKLAQDVLDTLAEKEENSSTGLPAFDIATQLEAMVAVGADVEAVRRKAIEYADAPDTDAFEFASTLRQFEEVWGLMNDTPPGTMILPILRGAQAWRQGGGITIAPSEAKRDLEKVFGSDKSVSLQWYLLGLARAKSVCRVEAADGKGFGTGWLVNSSDFFPGQPHRPLVLTNAHVISRDHPKAIRPPDAYCNFQIDKRVLRMKNLIWSSPETALDATFIDLDGEAGLDPMPLAANPVVMEKPAPRLYIIGHPGGRDLEFSINDNELVDCGDLLLHYRTPTEGGSSGSPVFEPKGWEVVGLHHAASKTANEGIPIAAIRKADKRQAAGLQ